MSRFLLITADVSFEEKLRLATAGALAGDVLTFSPDLVAQPEDVLDLLTVQQPEVLVLGPGVPLDGAVRLATIVDVRFPNLSMVLVAEENADVVLSAMR